MAPLPRSEPSLCSPPAALLHEAFAEAIEAARPSNSLPRHLHRKDIAGETVIASIGKAAYAMADTASTILGPSIRGIVLTRYGHRPKTNSLPDGLELVEASHPVPDQAGEDAARRIFAMAQELTRQDRFIFFVSGGGSALLSLPGHCITLSEKRKLVADLLASGASIGEINCVRKHLSAIKGGRLALAAHPASIETYCISDVAGDDPTSIASGPTIHDQSFADDARAVLERYAIPSADLAAKALDDPRNALPSPDHPAFGGRSPRILANNGTARRAAGDFLRERGYDVIDLGEIEGDASAAGTEQAAVALSHRGSGERKALVSGGECTVRLGGEQGQGGPNGEYLLALAAELKGASGIHALACDTDGIDGNSVAAGAIVRPDTLARAKTLGIDWDMALTSKQSHHVFARLGDTVVTGPTLTNVNDLRIILIENQ